MEYKAFEKLVQECRAQKPIVFELEHDEIVSAEEITAFENCFEIIFSSQYKTFLLNYGGGFFGYANIYSLDKDSNFYLCKYNDFPVNGYLRIADNGCGDYYLLRVEGHKCLEKVFFYEHDTQAVWDTGYADIFEYLAKAGLKV